MTAIDKNITPENSTDKRNWAKRLFGTYEIVSIALICLSIIGIAITDYSPENSRHYWIAMVVVFAGACLFLEWSRARDKGQEWATIMKNQILIWIGLFLAVNTVFLLQNARELNNENAGLIILLLLALTTFFAGVNLGWRLMVVGLFLGLAVIGAALLAEYALIFIFIAVVIIAIFIIGKHYAGVRREN